MGISILLADDSITIQKVIGIIFGGEDYSVTVVDNGKAAVEKAIEINPDVLLIDALMPGMTGYEVCERIREIPELKSKPIILLTGSFEPFDEEKAKSCGADTFLSKPFESQQIVNKVAEMHKIGQSRASATQLVEPVSAVMPPTLSVEAATHEQEPAADIWGAFTPDDIHPSEPAAADPFAVSPEPEAFETIQEKPETAVEQPFADEAAAGDQIGSQWVPAEEHTFEFEEETLAEPPKQVIPAAEQMEEQFFGKLADAEQPKPIEFETVTGEPATAFSEKAMPGIQASVPTFEESTKPEFAGSAAVHSGSAMETSTPVFAPSSVVETVPAALTEEQLKAALASVSKDVIERIVWEVVPDLAEAMIKEAIRKIKEGQ